MKRRRNMRTRIGGFLLVGLVLVALSGCATTATTEVRGMPNADNPEYLSHPFRLAALPIHFTGNLVQYGLIEPLYFLLARAPDAVGLSAEEQQYLSQREDA